MDMNTALELEAKISKILKNEIPNLYITMKSEKEGDYVLIIRECPQLKDMKS